MNKTICALGIVIIIGSLFLFSVYESETFSEKRRNPEWIEWFMEGEIGPEPPFYIEEWQEVRYYKYQVVAAIVLLIGFVTLFIGGASPNGEL